MPKNTYTDEFKADAVRLYEDTTGASFSMIAPSPGNQGGAFPRL